MPACYTCKEDKPRSAFNRCSSRKNGLQGTCRDCNKKRLRKRRSDPEYKRERAQRQRQRYASDPEYRDAKLARNRAYQAKNNDKIRRKNIRWRENNPQRHREIMRAIKHRYRARKSEAPGDASSEAIEARIAYWGERCWLCGGEYEAVDHVIPLNKGGTNWPANLRPICTPCNSSKRDSLEYAPSV